MPGIDRADRSRRALLLQAARDQGRVRSRAAVRRDRLHEARRGAVRRRLQAHVPPRAAAVQQARPGDRRAEEDRRTARGCCGVPRAREAAPFRGTALDIFGQTAERRMERALIGEYETLDRRSSSRKLDAARTTRSRSSSRRCPSTSAATATSRSATCKDAKAREAALLAQFRARAADPSRCRRRWRRRSDARSACLRPRCIDPTRSSAARAWFAAQGFAPFPFQEEVWARLRARRIRAAPRAHRHGQDLRRVDGRRSLLGPRGSADAPPPLTVLWLTPMRALAADTGAGARTRGRARCKPHWTRRRAHRRHAAPPRARGRTGGCPPRSSPRPRA